MILDLVRELAAYERQPDAVHATIEQFATALFPHDGPPAAFCHLACVEDAVAGMALWFPSFSTWTGTTGIWLEDLYVRPAHRGLGLGRELLATLAAVCVERGYHRLEWWVLDWNAPSIEFYRALGAHPQEEWTRFRLDGAALGALGAPGALGAG